MWPVWRPSALYVRDSQTRLASGHSTHLFLRSQSALVTLWSQMGMRWEGLLPALVVPLFLTFVLFLGPLVQAHLSVPITATLRMYLDPLYWYNTAQNPIWWRNQLVAPFSEEFTFRACMLPILLQCLTPGKAIFVAPLFFGVAHLHHAVDRLRAGITLPAVILISTVERLFSMGSDILRPKRSALTANNFKKLVFLKGNLHMLNQKKWEEEEEED
ncbi:CAAX prenyl protease 2 [Chionoecetes opilio]|uniref:CAAX prenyl protease 2 n=1 Tax=Chionoecetes opilio TaxID=41210 RepID=A0A8J4Y5R8_CHIOP|nr:CAAX prenyl protease 2 [Chionoecetes opilio]